MPGVTMASGSSSPGSTRCSTSTIVSLRGGRHHRIEVARGLAVDEIALGVALPGMDERDVGGEPGFHHERLVVEIADLLAFGDDGADARCG